MKRGSVVTWGFVLVWVALSAVRVPFAMAVTEEEKIEAVREMFSSPYQEEDYYRTDRLLLTATGALESLHRAPAVASVITAADIERLGAITLDEVLETVPGVHVGISSKNRMAPVYSIRGIQTSTNPQVLLMVNGLPVTYTYTGGRPETFRMPVTNISRVEVIRGPGSAVHGADAFAGVINVITKKSYEIDGARVGARGGSFDTRDAWLEYGGRLAGWDVALNMEHLASNGDPDRIIDADAVSGTGVSLAPGEVDTNYKIWNGSLELSRGDWILHFWSWIQEDGGIGAGVTQTLGSENKEQVERFQVDATYRADDLLPDWDMSARASYVYLHDDGFLHLLPPGITVPIDSNGNIPTDLSQTVGLVSFPDGVIGNPIVSEHQGGLDFTAFYSGLRQHRWRIGTGFKYLLSETEEYKNFGPGVLDIAPLPAVQDGILTEVGDGDIFMENQYRRIGYISLQDEWSFARHWDLTGGVRYDHYSDFGDTVNPRAALVWETAPALTTKLLYGQAFRPPSFTELYSKNNPSSIGNPDLDPETIETFELAFDYQPTSDLRLILNLFTYDIEDLIEFVPDAGATSSTAQNTKNQEGNGFEVEADWEATDTLRLRGNFAFQRSKNKDTQELTAEAPGWQLYLEASWSFLRNWSLDTQFNWVGDRRRAATDTRPDIDNYALVHCTLHRRNIAGRWDAALVVRNLFDVDAREPGPTSILGDFPLAGRSVLGELRYSF